MARPVWLSPLSRRWRPRTWAAAPLRPCSSGQAYVPCEPRPECCRCLLARPRPQRRPAWRPLLSRQPVWRPAWEQRAWEPQGLPQLRPAASLALRPREYRTRSGVHPRQRRRQVWLSERRAWPPVRLEQESLSRPPRREGWRFLVVRRRLRRLSFVQPLGFQRPTAFFSLT